MKISAKTPFLLLILAAISVFLMDCQNSPIEKSYTRPVETYEEIVIRQWAGEYPEGAFWGNPQGDTIEPCCVLPFCFGHLVGESSTQNSIGALFWGDRESDKKVKCEILGSIYLNIAGESRKLIITSPRIKGLPPKSTGLVRDRIDHPERYEILEHWLTRYSGKYNTRIVRWADE